MKAAPQTRSRGNSDISQSQTDTEEDEHHYHHKSQNTTDDNSDHDLSSDEKPFIRPRMRRSRSTGSTTDTEFLDTDDFLGFDTTTDDEQEKDDTDIPANKIQSVLAYRQIPNLHGPDGKALFEFLVKFAGQSYRNCLWVAKSEINNVMLKNFLKSHPIPPDPPYFNPEYTTIDYIIGEKNGKFLVKWKELDYDNATYETRETLDSIDNTLIPKFELDNQPPKSKIFVPPRPKPHEWKRLQHYKTSKRGYTLKSYQLEGLNFLTRLWYQGKNAILADEMGLGKTCQTSVFIDFLVSQQNIAGPFLIVVPLSTLSHWERELADWTDNLRVLTYYGIKEKRKYQKMFEFFYPGTEIPKFNILLTTYQYIMRDAALFSNISWRCVAIDEAHRLKNHESKLINCFRQFTIDFKLLLTGTPLQNNIQELWTLLNFLNPAAFENLQDFQSKFGELTESDQVIQLRTLLDPIMIRRRKGDVENSIIPLEEIIIECPMTQHQKIYYKSIFTRNLEYLSRGAHKDNTTNLVNISMELRKVCNHPYLIKGAEEQILIELRDSLHGAVSDEYSFVNDSLIRSAGKMILLDKLLKKLKEDGHRVLIFSQMTKMLDILQDYLVYRNYPFERLDGKVRGDLRQASIDHFNAPDSQDFVFLLCTKAGGVGINLTSADTVIIYDSDWNPQNDIQATARCHRIGQTKEVKMYRFITARSYERKMFETASVKLGLDQALLDHESKKNRKEELDKLLKLGAYYALEDEDNETDKFNENEDIDTVLLRSTKIKHENIGNNSKFSYTQFELDESDSQIDVTAPDFWQKYLPDVQEDDLSLEGISMGERKRILRAGQDPSEAVIDTTIEPTDNGDWNKKRLAKVMSNFMRFGWGRWKVIYENSEVVCPVADIKEACIVLLGWVLKASEEHYPVLESIYNHSRSNETKEFEALFKHYSDIKLSCSSSASKKLSRLDLLYFLNGAVSTCPNPPDDIIVPDISNQKPTDWWTDKDDQLLMYGAWQYGYMNYDDIKFTNPEFANADDQNKSTFSSNLTKRLKNLIIGLKNSYMTYKEKIGDANIPFNYETLKISQELINKRDHKNIIHYLNYFGYPSPERFRKATNLMNKSNELIDEYVQNIISFCKTGNTSFEQKLADKVARPDRLLQNVELFVKVRDNKDSPEHRIDDQKLFEYIDENGLIGLNSQDFIVNRFGTENLEGTVLKYLKKIFQPKISGPKSGGSRATNATLHSYAIPDYEKNEDGTPKLPIHISQIMIIKNLGHVVYDRPNWHSERYIYPADYEAERLFTSIEDPTEKTWYEERIIDKGGDYPIFHVEMKGDPKKRVFEGPAPSKPWTDIVKYIEERKKKLNIGVTRCTTISGPEMFGLYSPLGSHLVQNLPNVDKCERFMKRKFKNDANNENDEDNNASSETEKDHPKPKESKPVRSKERKSHEPSYKAKTVASEETSLIKSRPQRKAAVRASENLQLFFDFADAADALPTEFLSVSYEPNQLVQPDRLDITVPVSDNPLKTAVERMETKITENEEAS